MGSPVKVFSAEELTMNVRYNYGRGRMTIYLPEYLASQTLSCIRKLRRLIESSETPEELEKMDAYVEAEKQNFEPRMRDVANKAVDARTRAKELQPELDRLIQERDRYKRNSDPYKAAMEKVKAKREEIRHYRAVYLSQSSEFKHLEKSKEKFNKL
jgi:chromosome segregation ATPase